MVQRALADLVRELSQSPEVEKIVLFGSLATGRYAPGSDVDLLIVLSHCGKPFRERLLDYLPRHFPVDVDVFPYTEAEIRRVPLAQEALRLGKVLWDRTSGG